MTEPIASDTEFHDDAPWRFDEQMFRGRAWGLSIIDGQPALWVEIEDADGVIAKVWSCFDTDLMARGIDALKKHLQN